jgi:Uma2 family endonuclease
MAVMSVMPRRGDWTVDDLDDLPDDGLRYELVDGVLLVSPAPSSAHQRAVGEVYFLLRSSVTPQTEVFTAPFDFRPSRVRSVQPDVLVALRSDVEPWGISAPPLLVVEVLSPGSRVTDLATKRQVYEESGVGAYWLVDPLAATITVLERDDAGALVEVARAEGDQPLTLTLPFPVTVVPSALSTPHH